MAGSNPGTQGEIDPARLAGMLKSVREVAAPWANSPYYANAEQWTPHFWDESQIFRRLFNRLDPDFIIELATGHGRHAERAAPLAGHLAIMDVLPENIEFCRARLRQFSNISYPPNDGFSFRPLESGIASAIFCYDAMVHFSPDLVASYLQDAQRVLRPGGRALFHHSNYAAPLDRHYGQNPHARNHMTQSLFAAHAQAAGLVILESVVIPWGEAAALDCVTLLEKPG